MNYMDKILYDILNHLDEGIIVLNEKLEISFWNHYMEYITGIKKEKAINNNIYFILPNLNKNYFRKSVDSVLTHGYNMFFSAALHNIFSDHKEKLNLKISQFQKNGFKFLLMEFINVTSLFTRIHQLKEHVYDLYILNKKLKEQEETIKKLAYYDSLTSIANRTLFYKLTKQLFNQVNSNYNSLGVMFIDIDQFKNINDLYGHKAGDHVLIHVANILKASTRKEDIVCRFGGDEFVVLLPYIKNIDNCKVIASKITNAKNKMVYYKEKKIHISLSIGIVFCSHWQDNIDELIVKADKAMYCAKNEGGNSYCCYNNKNSGK
jgi:diguanylate cyclase (GGDEF)-like protein/PAS domain S-box-containing protein